jgi:Protein of unknown function (DUF2442)
MVEVNTETQIDTQIAEARRAAALASTTEPRAIAADYNAQTGLVNIRLKSDAVYSFPAKVAQFLSDAPPELIAEVEVTPAGDGLHWETLDADFTMKGLLAGIFGTKAWMAELYGQWDDARRQV